jgi:hypothetical protein
MREMQCGEQCWFVTGIKRRHKAIERGERGSHRPIVRLGLSSVDGDGRSPSSRSHCGQV